MNVRIYLSYDYKQLICLSLFWAGWASGLYHVIKGVKKVRSTIKLCSYYYSHYVSDDINVTGIL